MVETRSSDRTIRDSWYWTVIKVTVLILVYFASELVYYQFTDFSPLLPWHPAVGIAFAVGFLGHPAYLIPIILCDFFTRTFLGGQPLNETSILYSILFGLVIVFIPKAAKRMFHLEINKVSLQDTITLAITALLVSLLLGISNHQLLPLNPLILPFFPVNAILFYSLKEFLGVLFIGFPILSYIAMIQDPANVELETVRGFIRSVRGSITQKQGVLAEITVIGLVTAILILIFSRLPGTEDLLIYTLYTIPIIYATIRFNRTVASFFFLVVFSLEMISASRRHFYLEEAIELELISASGIVIAYIVNAFVMERHQFYLDISTGEERLKAVANLTPFGLCQVDRNGTIAFANQRFSQLAGFPENEIAGTKLAEVTHPDDLNKLQDAISKSIKDHCIVQIRFRLISPDEEMRWVQGSCTPVQKELTKPRYILISISDITSLVTSEEEIRSSADLLSSFLDNLPDPAWLKDEYGKYLAINQEMEKLHNVRRELILGKMDEEIFDPSTAKSFIEADRLVMESQKPMRFESQLRPETPQKWYETYKSPWVVEGKVKGAVGISREISDRYHMEQALKESEARLKSLLNNIPDQVYLKDNQKVFLAANETFCNYFGIHNKEIAGKTNQDVFEPDYALRVENDDNEVIQTRKPLVIESSIQKNGDITAWFETIKVPVLDEKGQVIGITAVSRDITQRKVFEESIQKRLRMESVLNGIAATLNKVEFENQSHEFHEVMGKIGDYLRVDSCRFAVVPSKPESSIELYSWESPLHPGTPILLPGNAEDNYPLFWGLIQNDHPIAWQASDDEENEGSREINHILGYTPSSIFCLPVFATNRNLLGLLWVEMAKEPRDWTEDIIQFMKIAAEMLASTKSRVLSEEKLSTAEARYRLLAEQIAAVVYIDEADEVSTGVYMSPRIKELTGYTAEEMAADQLLFWRLVHPDDRDRVDAENKRTNLTGEPFEIEYRMVRKDGKVIWVLDHALSFNDESGKQLWHGVLMDITERKQIEEALSESQARFHDLFEHTPIALWEEDFTQVKKRLDYLKNVKSVSNIQEFLSNHPKEVHNLIGMVKIIDVNKASIELLNLTTKDEIFENYILAQQLRPDELFIKEMAEISNGSTHFSIEGANDIKDGIIRYHNLHFIVVPGYEKTFGRAIVAITDITDRKISEEQLIFLSTHDGLTGLYSRSYFEAEMARLQVSRLFPISILIADADFLKETNDQFGHAAGDQLLKKAAQALRMTFRPEDVVARIGGDEFAVLLPKTEGETGECLRGRLQKMIAEENDRNSKPFKLDLSIGVATAMEGDSLVEILREADQRMYEDKLKHHQNK